MQAVGAVVYVAAPFSSGDEATLLELKSRNINVLQIPMQRAGINPFRDFLTLVSLYRVVGSVAPDVVLGYTIKPVVYGGIVAFLRGVDASFSLITGLGYSFTGEPRGRRRVLLVVVRSLYCLALATSKKVFFQNPDDQALFRSLRILSDSKPSVVVNGSGIDVDSFNLSPIPEGKVNFLLIARLLGDKGIREYAIAAAMMKDKYPAVECQLVGWIDENPDAISQTELDSWIQSGCIKFLGKLSDVRPAIADCTVYVLPSYREGTPRTVLEAMAMGRAIITTDAPGCRETVVDGENGFLVPVKDSEKLAEAMMRFVEQPELVERMGRRSREIAEEKYDVHKVNAVMLREMGLVS
jgi:glycosyltransferase involved in cell wall biosynthesis